MTTQNYSVIVGEVPTDIDSAIVYLQHLCANLKLAERMFVVISEEYLLSAIDFGQIEELAKRTNMTLVLSHNSIWDGINRAVAEAETEHVFILEREMWLASGIEFSWLGGSGGPAAPVTYFEKRQSYDNDVPLLRAGAYSRSSPELKFKSSNVYAIERKIFLDLRGYDERPSYRDVADIDLRTRLVRARVLTSQLRGPDAVAYIPSANSKHSIPIDIEASSEKAKLAKVNRDKSIYRNLVDWSVPNDSRPPLVTVAIATKDRGDMLTDALNSVLFQTFQDFEIIVVDDGSADDSAKREIERINDHRIRYIYQDSAGISAARNRAADESRCTFTAVHDDDDIMLPDRLEVGLRCITSPHQSTFGGWINFGDGNGQMKEFYGKLVFDSNVNAHNGQGPGHATWTVPTKLIQRFRYDEKLTASVDHNLATRMEVAGVEWSHTGKFMYLRRVHDNQVTALDSSGQKVGHSLSRYLSNLSSSPDQLAEIRAVGESTKYPRISNVQELLSSYRAYLPDKLVGRKVKMEGNTQNLQFDADVPDKMALIVEDRDILNNRNIYESAILNDISLTDVATFRRRGLVKYSWIVEMPRVASDSSQNSMYGSSDDDLESVSYEQSQAHVFEVLNERVALVTEKLLLDSPQGSLLVVDDAESYSIWIETELTRDAVQARRILVAGEFGVKRSARIYLYRTVEKGKEILARSTVSGKLDNPSLISR